MKQVAINIDRKLTLVGQQFGVRLIELSLSLIYIWFGALKLFPGISPAESLAGSTLSVIFLNSISAPYLVVILGIAELVIGLALLASIRRKIVVYSLLTHMIGTLTPMIFFPDLVYGDAPLSFTIVGQYIMKNFVIISVIFHLYSSWNKNSQ
ncbi:MAG: hypothetical protein JXQ90_00650 [Cyclobacteriaceae bacterium]